MFKPLQTVEEVDSVVLALVDKSIERKKIEDAFRLTTEDIILNEIVIEDYKMTPAREKVIKRYGKPNRVISGEAILAKEEKWSYGLYSILLFNFPDIIIRRVNHPQLGSFLYAQVTPSQMTLVVIDGIPVKIEEFPFVPNIPPGEVSSFEVIRNAHNFAELYRETVDPTPFAPTEGDVIAIYTHAGKGIHGVQPPSGILKTDVLLFSPVVEFYAPKYKKLMAEDWVKPDLRALVHWQPLVEVDTTGKTSISFYNADNVGEMLIIAEGISVHGEIGCQELKFQVKKKPKNQ